MHNLVKVVTLLTGIVILSLSNGLINTLLPLRGNIEGFSSTWIGSIMSSYYCGFIIATITLRRIIIAVGYVRIFAGMAALNSALILCFLLLPYPTFWLLARIIYGFCIAGILMVAETWINEVADNKNRGFLMSSYMAVLFFGLSTSQLTFIVVSPSAGWLFSLVSILTSISTIPCLFFVKFDPPPPAAVQNQMSLKDFWLSSPLGFLAAPLLGSLVAISFTMLPLYLTSSGYDRTTLALAMWLLIILGAAGQIPLGRVSDYYDRRIVMTVGIAISSLALILLLTGTQSTQKLLLMIGIYGFFALPIYTLLVAHVNDRLQPDSRLAATVTLIRLNSCGAAIGPFVAGIIMDVWQPIAIFYLLLLIIGAVISIATIRMFLFREVKVKFNFFNSLIVNPVAQAMRPTILNRLHSKNIKAMSKLDNINSDATAQTATKPESEN